MRFFVAFIIVNIYAFDMDFFNQISKNRNTTKTYG